MLLFPPDHEARSVKSLADRYVTHGDIVRLENDTLNMTTFECHILAVDKTMMQ